MKVTIPLPAYLPDQTVNSGGLSVADNVLPRTDGYGPVSQFSGFTNALSSPFRGGQSFITKDGTTSLIVGTTTGLERYNAGAWTNLVTSLSVASQWKFAQFGDFGIGVNGSVTKEIDLAAGTVATLTGAPTAIAVAIVGDYVVMAQDSSDKLGIFTSAEGDHTDWDVVNSTATYQPMLAGGEVMGLAGGEFGVILQRQRLVRMSRTGDANAPFQYDVISENVGCASKGSVAQFSNMVFWLSDSGFKMLVSGQELRPIGSEKIDRTFIASIPRDDFELIYSAVDPQAKTVMWCVPGTPGTVWVYNWELDRWTTISLAIDAIFPGFTSSTDLDTLAVTYPDPDAMTISLDDPRWAGGNPRLYVVQGGVVGTFNGATLAATLEFSFAELVQGRTTRIRAIRPVTDCLDGQTITVDHRARLGDDPAIKTASSLRDSGIMPIRATGRYSKPKWSFAAGSEWTYAQGLEFEYEAGGER